MSERRKSIFTCPCSLLSSTVTTKQFATRINCPGRQLGCARWFITKSATALTNVLAMLAALGGFLAASQPLHAQGWF
jgi:hypothetical protein